MVVFVDLDGEDNELQDVDAHTVMRRQRLNAEDGKPESSSTALVRSPPAHQTAANMNGFSAAVSCYPVAFSLASHLDLNDLHSLSLTCRQIHDNLVQFAHQLVSSSLRCSNASQPLLSDVITRFNDSIIIRDTFGNTISGGYTTAGSVIPDALPGLLAALSAASSNQTGDTGRLLQSNKIGECASDLVAECRKCGTVVCRNCTAKPPSDRSLPYRFRRLCRACLNSPISAHLQPLKNEVDRNESPPASSASSAKSVRSVSSSSTRPVPSGLALQSFTSNAFLRRPCTCHTRGVYLCTSCGQNLRAADTTYKRVWTWRSRYSTHIGGGLGTGLGEGDQGQKCGRGSECLESGSGGVCWVEIDCSETKQRDLTSMRDYHSSSEANSLGLHRGAASVERDRNQPGYLQQEMEGIGGVVKKKVKKRIKVGATVWEYDDERETGRYLEREASGVERSWCGWCSRVVPSEADKAELEN